MGNVLFFDIDGTLIDYHGNMPASTKTALEQARYNGHQIVICSGRSRFQIAEELLQYADGLVGATGAYAEFQGNILYEHFMPVEIIQEVCEVLKEASAFVVGMSRTTTMMNRDCQKFLKEKFEREFNQKNKFDRVFGDPVMTDKLNIFFDIQKILYYNSVQEVDQIAERLSHICDVTASSFEKEVVDSGEITLKGINKSYGMRRYMELQKLSSVKTIAFGDGPNDVDMIEYADIGVVMGNGRAVLKEKADFVTKDVEEDGIYYAMRHLHLID